MYRKNMMSGRGYREPVPRSCHAHGIPFPGDSILFRLPRRLPVPPAGKPSGTVPRYGLSFPGTTENTRLLLSGVHVVCLILGGFTPPALQAAFS